MIIVGNFYTFKIFLPKRSFTLRLTTPHFHMYYDPSEDPTRGRERVG